MTAALVAAVVLLGGAVEAMAAIRLGAYVTVTKQLQLTSGQSGWLRVRCPAGHRVTAGGTSWIRDGAETDPLFRTIGASAPLQGGRVWYVAATNGRFPGDVTTARLVVTIRCLPEARIGPITVVRQDFERQGTGAEGYAGCPVGLRLISGGAMLMSGYPGSLVPTTGPGVLRTNAPIDRATWIATAHASGAGFEFHGLRVIALCIPDAAIGATSIRYRASDLSSASSPPRTARCPTGTRVLVGGVFWTDLADGLEDGIPLGISTPTADSSGWRARSTFSGAGAIRLKVVIVCRRV